MTAFTIDAGDILLNETAKVDLLFDAVPVVRGDTGDPCTVSPATCTGYKHITYPGPPEPNDPPTSATGAPGAIHAPDHVLPIGNSSYHCFDTWEDTLNNEVYVLLESFSESSPDWQKKNTMIAFTFLGEYNLDNGYTFGSMEVPHGMLEEAKFYDDGTTDLDGLYEALAQPVFAHMIANNLMTWAGGYLPTAPFALPQTVEYWKNCTRKPIMKYENEGLPRPPHGGGADAQMYGGNYVWAAGVSSFNTGGAGFGYLADATFRSAAGTNPLIKYGGDPTISGSDPNQYIEYCP
ncbi:MAG: hypothetical protein GY905_12750, partial [Gammaproteobacteria bacterium]|nr:hypothetical protein [Gammaproteobacteria bacterium]